nr:hypothetical protein [Bacillus pseudomycoides]
MKQLAKRWGGADLTNYAGPYAENVSYRAPNFKSGEFNISVHHTKDDGNFTKSIKVLYPNGKSEIHNLRSGQQLQITEAGCNRILQLRRRGFLFWLEGNLRKKIPL